MKVKLTKEELSSMRGYCKHHRHSCKIYSCPWEKICDNIETEKYPSQLTDDEINQLAKDSK